MIAPMLDLRRHGGFDVILADPKQALEPGQSMLDRVLALHSEGKTAKEAKALLQTSYPTLAKWAKRGGVKFPPHHGARPEAVRRGSEHAEALRGLPTFTNDALKLGKAGEHFVCADLLSKGYDAFLSDQGLPFDVVLIHQNRLIRIQVKTAAQPRNSNAKGKVQNLVYSFSARRRGKGGAGEALNATHCDVVAFVGLAHKAIAYFKVEAVGQTVALFPPGYKFPGGFRRSRKSAIDGYPIEGVL